MDDKIKLLQQCKLHMNHAISVIDALIGDIATDDNVIDKDEQGVISEQDKH